MSNLPLLNYKRAGTGPTMVILHGLLGSLDNFRSVGLHLERYFDVLRIDLPAHGESPSLPEINLLSMSDALRHTLDTLDVNHCHLLGHSLGGKVAMQLASVLPAEQLKSLLVVDIAPRDYPELHTPILEALSSIDLTHLTSRRQAEAELRGSIVDAGMRAFLLKGLYRTTKDQWAWRFDIKGLKKDYPELCKAPEIIEAIEAPTLFIKGGNSDYLSAQDESEIRRLFSNPRFKEIAGTGHWPHAEKPAVFTEMVLDFAQVQP
ncbi:MAG: alpha/beta fold hydrolase [Gammaproteobacteria bacterium]|nr:alpha/beta fold hydrolase [Gammaproteobacteria bacterium]